MVRELTLEEFQNFVSTSPIATYYQTRNYALLMGEYGYDYDYVGYVDEYGYVKAATLILIKSVSFNFKYGYAPRGFILDFFNQRLVKLFTQGLIEFYKKKRLCFIKLNPEIAISELDISNGLKTYNWNYEILDILKDNNYLRLKENVYFESILPRFQAIIPLRVFRLSNLAKNARNNVRKCLNRGLHLELAPKSGIDILQRFIERKKDTSEFYYRDYYNMFSQDNMIDLFLVSIDSQEYLMKSRSLFENELELNTRYQENLEKKSNQLNINKKMESDRKLVSYKNDVAIATEMNKKNDKIYIAGALIIKYQNHVHILISGYDIHYKHFEPNTYLHYAIMDYYKDNFDYLDMNGMTGDFTKDNPYYGLNQFKLSFRPKVYEYIGEYDLPILSRKYYKLRNNGTLAKIFNKKKTKKELKRK